jgi:hypothetical protein
MEALPRDVQARLLAAEASVPDDLRSAGWSVAAHYDYQTSKTLHTFWLLTRAGRYVEAHGATDHHALNFIRSQLEAFPESVDLLPDVCVGCPHTRRITKRWYCSEHGPMWSMYPYQDCTLKPKGR